MGIKDIIEGKKEWRAHTASVKDLPKDYQIVYNEIQKYIFKLGPVDTSEGIDILSNIVVFLKEGAALGKDVLEVTGNDVAAFCDELIKDTKTYSDIYEDSVNKEAYKSIKDYINKTN